MGIFGRNSLKNLIWKLPAIAVALARIVEVFPHLRGGGGGFVEVNGSIVQQTNKLAFYLASAEVDEGVFRTQPRNDALNRQTRCLRHFISREAFVGVRHEEVNNAIDFALAAFIVQLFHFLVGGDDFFGGSGVFDYDCHL